MTLCRYLSWEHPIRLAHRGSGILWPENTLVSFQGAISHGCKYIETDVQMTKDGVLVLFHDKYLQRLTDGKGRIRDWKWNDLQRLDAAYYFQQDRDFPCRGQGIKIPCLEEVMKTFPEIMFNLDLKQSLIEHIIADFINNNNFHDRVLVASFDDRKIRKFRKIMGNKVATSAGGWECRLIWALSRFWGNIYSSAKAIQVPYRRGWLSVIDPKLIKAAHAQGIQVHAWTVNDSEKMHQLVKLGVDGIVTDRIDLLNEVLSNYKLQISNEKPSN